MALMLGSFAGGLWQGAAGAMSLAREYQQFQTYQSAQAYADSLQKAQAGQQPAPDATQSASALPIQTGDGSGDGTGDGTSDGTTSTAPTVPVKKEDLPAPKRAWKKTPDLPAIGPQGQVVSPQPVAPSTPSTNVAGVQGPPGSPSGPAVGPSGTTPPAVAGADTSTPPLTDEQRRGQAPLPVARTIVTTDPTQANTPLARGVLPQPNVPPRAQVSPTQMPTYDTPSGGYTAAPAAPAPAQPGPAIAAQPPPPTPAQAQTGVSALTSPNAGVQDPGSAAVAQAKATGRPVPVQGGNGLVANPDGTIGTPGGFSGGAAQPAPAAAPAPAAGRSVGGAILGALNAVNPIGTAEAAPASAAPAAAPAAAPTAAPAPGTTRSAPPPTPNAPPVPPPPAIAARTAAATPAILQPRQGTPAGSPATPPAQTAARPQAVAPAVTGRDGKMVEVAPDQKGPSTQSEVTPPRGGSTDQWFKSLPDEQQRMLTAVAHRFGEGYVTPQQLAAIWKREGGLQSNVQAGDGGVSMGPFQIQRTTQQVVDPNLQFDTSTPEGGAIVAAKLLKYYAVKYGLGADSMLQNYAYGRGEGALQTARATGYLQPQMAGFLKDQGFGAEVSQYKGGGGNVRSDGQIWNGVMNAGHMQGPDGVLRSLVAFGPQGDQSMSQLWRNAQAAGERYMILSGHPEGLPAMQDWFAQMSHQGALSNLAAAHNALLSGNGAMASNYLAKAHAFFPDGSMGRFGTDNSGNVWGQQISEQTGKPIGAPMQITPDGLARQMIMLQHPNNYLDALVSYRQKTAAADMAEAHAGYYHDLPEIRREQQAGVEQRHQESLAAAGQRQQISIAARNQQQQATADRQQDTRDRQDDARADKEASTLYGPSSQAYQDAGGDPAKINGLSTRADVYRVLRGRGGSDTSGVAAGNAAERIAGEGFSARPVTDANGNKGYRLTSKDGKTGLGVVSEEQMRRLHGIVGTGSDLAPRSGPRQQAAIGAGASSQMAAMSGANQSLAGPAPPPLAA
jgi:hypothetical protein